MVYILLTELRFNVRSTLNLVMFFPANLSASTEKIQIKVGRKD